MLELRRLILTSAFILALASLAARYVKQNVRMHWYLESLESVVDGAEHVQDTYPVASWGVYSRLIVDRPVGAAQEQQHKARLQKTAAAAAKNSSVALARAAKRL